MKPISIFKKSLHEFYLMINLYIWIRYPRGAYKQFKCSINSQKLKTVTWVNASHKYTIITIIYRPFIRLITSFTKTEKFSHLCAYTHTHKEGLGSLIQPVHESKIKEQNSPICCSSFGRRVVRTQRMERSHYLSSRHKNLFPWMSFFSLFKLYKWNNMEDSTSGRRNTISGCRRQSWRLLNLKARPGIGLGKPRSWNASKDS